MLWLLAQGGGRTGIPWQQLISILFGVFMVLGTVIQAMIKAGKERQAKQKLELERRRRQDEYLRTGRMPPGTPASEQVAAESSQSAGFPSSDDEAKRRLAEIARRRREELEKLARAGQGQGASGSGSVIPAAPATRPTPAMRPPTAPMKPGTPSPRPVVAAGPRPGSPVVAVPRPAPTRQQAQQQQQQRQRQEAEQRARAQEQRRREQQQRQAAQSAASDFHSVSESIMDAPGTVHRLVQDTAPAGTVAQRPALLAALNLTPAPGKPRASADELRRAFILSEVLGKPLSQRGGVDRD